MKQERDRAAWLTQWNEGLDAVCAAVDDKADGVQRCRTGDLLHADDD